MTGPRHVRGLERTTALVERFAGPWRVAVVEGSMEPTVRAGDWLLVDPTVGRWPRRGSIVVFREPESSVLAIKRVIGRPGDWVQFSDGWLQLGDDEAWLEGDATDEALAEAGHGAAVDSRRYGPVTVDALVARAWFRYWPAEGVGPVGRAGAPARRSGAT